MASTQYQQRREEKAFGFSFENVDEHYNTMEFAWLTFSTIALVNIGGLNEYTVTGVQVGDVFRIERQGSTIYWLRNGLVEYVESDVPVVSMIADAAIKTTGASIESARASFDLPDTVDLVPDAVELSVLKDFYDSLSGYAWWSSLGWPAPGNWPYCATSETFQWWEGVTVENGDIVELNFPYRGLYGSLPPSLGLLTSLRNLDFSFVSYLFGEIPAEFGQLKKLEYLDLSLTSISGELPSTIGNLNSLKTLKIQQCYLDGELPSSLGNLSSLKHLDLWFNDFTGPIPAEIENLTSLEYLNLSLNKFSGVVPNFTQLSSLKHLALEQHLGFGDVLTGTIQLGSQLEYVDLAGNTGLNASLSQIIQNSSKLKTLDLTLCDLTGSIPSEIDQLDSLEYLGLGSANLSGNIPSSIGNFSFLRTLNLGGNDLVGTIPDEIGNIDSLRILVLSSNNLEGHIPQSLTNCTKLSQLILRSNQLTGTLPANIGNCLYLSTIDLAYNSFSGPIPESLVNCQALRELVIMSNNFTSLPYGVVNNPFLSLVYVAQNKLDFSSLEPFGTAVLQQFHYAPQKYINDVSNLTFVENQLLEIPSRSPGQHSSIVWEKLQPNGSWVNVNSLNEDQVPFQFLRHTAAASDTGTYRWTMTNTLLPALTLQSEPIEVQVVDPVANVLEQWSFQYRYDARKRMTMKKVPGADWVYMVYDKRDRLVMTQDGNQRAADPKEWTFTKYDALNRPILTGIYKDTGGRDQEAMQEDVNAYYDNHPFYETLNGSVHGYTNQTFPDMSNESDYLTVTYYDNYTVADTWSGFSYADLDLAETVNNVLYEQPDARFPRVTGQVTATKVKNLDDNTWLKTVSYYDDRYRVVQTVTDNVRGGKDRGTSLYDFTGKVLRTVTTHMLGETNEQTVARRFVYDHAGRLLQTYHQVNQQSEVLLSENEYNELGQAIAKKLHSEDNGTSFKQHVDYRYNIRGWLTRINNSDLTPDNTNEPRDLFGMNLSYNDVVSGLNNSPQYNGNISATKWSTNLGLGIAELDQSSEKAYTYTYDPLNRLTAATHKEKQGGWNASNDFHEDGLTYDLNGNILSLARKGAKGIVLDALSYDYGTGAERGNKLLKVSDTGDPTKGFVDGLNSGYDYAYDVNGNMTHDLNKKIGASLTDNTSNITYNYLNLPVKVQKGNGEKMINIYDATGRKLSQVIHDSSVVVTKRVDYAGEFYYENDTLRFINTEEGRVIPEQGGGAYEYHLKDHLGNVRMTFTTKQEVDTYTAGYEDANIATEQTVFNPSYDNAAKGGGTLFNHTPGGNKSQRLSAANENEIIGLAKSLKVVPGDTIKLEVHAKYSMPQADPTDVVDDILVSISSAFGLSPSSTGIGELAYQSLVAMDNLGALINTGPDVDQTAPKAYLNYILFDEDFVPYDFGFDQISQAGLENGNGVPHEKLQLTAVARVPGYAYVYLSNESNTITDVYFDDLLIEHRHSPVQEESFYYPFGLMAQNYNKPETTNQPFKYNGKEEIEFTNWLDYGARMYMSELGRFSTQDNYSEKYYPLSLYQYAANNPISLVDIHGDSIWFTQDNGRWTLHYTGKVLNLTDHDAPSAEDYVKKIKSAFAFIEGFDLDIQFTDAKSVDDVSKTDHLFVIVDEVDGANGITGMSSDLKKFLKISYVEGGGSTKNILTTMAHEGGHQLGLLESYMTKDKSDDNGNNLMSYVTKYFGISMGDYRDRFNQNQANTMVSQWQNGNLNYGANTSTAESDDPPSYMPNWFFNLYHSSSPKKPYKSPVKKGDNIPIYLK